tara:strand:+ start:221 stop:463 length:243 start_codon:yes stop_codon:yes gene_type:complete
MMSEYWVFAIITFLFVLSVKKYIDLDSLRETIEDYLAQISPVEIEKEEDIVALEELRDMVEDFVIRNPEIFSQLNNNKDE